MGIPTCFNPSNAPNTAPYRSMSYVYIWAVLTNDHIVKRFFHCIQPHFGITGAEGLFVVLIIQDRDTSVCCGNRWDMTEKTNVQLQTWTSCLLNWAETRPVSPTSTIFLFAKHKKKKKEKKLMWAGVFYSIKRRQMRWEMFRRLKRARRF